MTDYTNFDPEELLALSNADFRREHYEAALFKLKALLARNQVPVDAYSLLGRIYATIGLFNKAKVAFNAFLREVPGALNERFQLGMVEKDLGNTDAALRAWDSIMESVPNFPPALYHKALVLADRNQIQDAVELLNHLLETAQEEDEYIPLADHLLSRLSLQ